MKKIAGRAAAVIAWILIWQVTALIVHNQILLAGPLDTVKALRYLAKTPDFWQSVVSTTLRILIGFALGSALGIALACLAYKDRRIEIFLQPMVAALKSVPVASFVILLLIWLGPGNISTIICAMVVFPILYLNSLEGLAGTDKKMLEMAKVFRMPTERKLFYIYLPQLVPFFKGAFKLAIGMSFKSGIAAEVIGQPLHTIGNGLYLSKIYLETGELFAWTIVVVLIAFICEKILSFILARI